MPSSLTATKIKDTYGQVLHVDGGVTSTPKLVYDGDGTATALKVSTTDVQVNNSPVLTDSDIGSTVQAYDADLTAWSGKTAPTGTVVGTTDTQTLSNKTFSDNPTFSAGTANGVAYLNGSKVLTTGSALTFDGTNFATTGTSSATKFIPTGGAATGNGMYLPAANNLGWSINGSEQMRLTSTGLGIGTSSPGTKLHVEEGNLLVRNSANQTSITATNNQSTAYTTSFTTNWDENILLISAANKKVIEVGGYTSADTLRLFTANTERARIDSSGNLQVSNLAGTGNRAVYSTSTGILTNSSSDRSLKENDTPISQGLDAVLAMRPISYEWIDKEKMGAQREIGFIAQEIKEIVPEVVGSNSDETLSIDYPKLVAVMAKAIQELTARVTALEAK